MKEIQKFEIDVLDVGAADAILIHIYANYEYVVLVDAGNEGDGEKILSHIRKYYNQQYIDLAICTHCDADHYGGFQRLIEEHCNARSSFSIKKFWVHDPYKHVDVDDVKYIRKKETLSKRLNDAYSFTDGSNLLDLIDEANIAREEPFAGKTYSAINLTVLGPSKDYYKSLIPDFRVDLDFKEEQQDDDVVSIDRLFSTDDQFYSKTLEEANDDPSKVNQSSVIFQIETNDGILLFTGDAGKKALHEVIDRDNSKNLSRVRFFKVPHHGSKHNLDNAIISYLKPKISYISTEKIGKFANKCTIHALKKVGFVYSTHKSSSLWHRSTDMGKREGYTEAEPL